MHEVGLMQQAVNIALTHAKDAGADRIDAIRMRVGALSGVVPDSLAFAFEIAAQGTIAQDAVLDIEDVPVTCYCAQCRREFTPDDIVYMCPACGRLSADIRAGREFTVSSIEIS